MVGRPVPNAAVPGVGVRAAAFALRGGRLKLFQRRGCCLENSAHAMSYSPNVYHSPSETTSTESPMTLMAVCSSMA
jgi:hypothetical protein